MRQITCPDCEGCGRIGYKAGGCYPCRLCSRSGVLEVKTPQGEDDALWEEVWHMREVMMPEVFSKEAIEAAQCQTCGAESCDVDHDAQTSEADDANQRANGPEVRR